MAFAGLWRGGARNRGAARGLASVAKAPDPPGPRYLTPLQLPRALREWPLEFLGDLSRQYGDIVMTRVGPFRSYMLVHPDHIKHVLQDNNHNYWKGILVGRAKVLIGEGLFTSEGDFWRRQRRLAQPSFHRQRIAGFARTMTDCTASMLAEWDARAKSGAPFDVSAEMSRVTLRVVGKALFGIDLQEDAAEVGRALLAVLEFVNQRAFDFFPAPFFLPTPRNLSFRRDRRALDRVMYRIIESRRTDGADARADAGDLLSMLMSARDEESDETMSDRQLRDEVITFVLAGHETTALALTWTWQLLAENPEVEAGLRAEIESVLGDRIPTLEDLPRLARIRRVVEETLRLYPPLPIFARQSLGEDVIGGYRIRARSIVTIVPYLTHRHPAIWQDAERFDPDRFVPERVAERPRFAYLPFSGGPRLCIGNEFALIEATLIVAMTLQRYRVRPLADRRPEHEVRLTLRPRDGLLVRLEVRGARPRP
jgi:cytochrome P450